MTRINKLVMEGFKSFAKRTELLFDDKFNVVIGPNGSGKSNVLDALCFVLGRRSTKSLRADKTAGLIYNGGKIKNPSSKAEVSIFFDNSDKIFPLPEKEIKVTRIAKQNGQSVYRINDVRSTLQQLVELLSSARIDPDGYNIVLQGDVDHLIEMSSAERRQVVEEIAGISVYEDKKEKAMSELGRVEERLREAEIVLAEREANLKELKNDRDQALKYKEMKDRIDQNKATYLDFQIRKKQKDIERIEKRTAEMNSEIEEFKKQVVGIKSEIDERRKLVEKITREIEEKGEKDELSVNKEVEELKVALATNSTKIESHKKEIAKIEGRILSLSKEIDDNNSRAKGLEDDSKALEKKKADNEKQIGRLESSMAEFRKKHNLDDLTAIEKEIEESEKEGERIDAEIHKLVEEKQNLLREKDKLEIQIDGMDKQIEKVGLIEKEHEAEITSLKKMKDEFKESVLKLNSMLTEASSISARLADAKERGRGLEETLGRLRVKAAGAKESALGDIAVTKILEQKSKIPGIFGIVSQLGKAPSRFSLALEIAAGQRIKNIVVESDETAAKCIDFLSKNRFGVATFLPLNKIKSVKIEDEVKELLKVSGVHGFASELIEHDAKYNRIFSYVFSDTIVVESIDVARRIGIGKARMVSLSGDLAEKSGAMTGGFRSREHRIGFSEKESGEELDKIEKQFSENSALQESLEAQKKKSEDAISELRVKKSALEGDITKIERGLHLESNDLDASKREKQLLRESAKKTDEKLREQEKLILSESRKLAEIKGKKQEMRIRISQLRDPSIIAELTAFGQKKQELSNENAGIDANVLGLKKQVEMVNSEADKAQKVLKQAEKEKGEFSEDIGKLEAQTKEKTAILKDKEALQKSFLAKFKKSFDERQKLNDEITRADAEITIKEEKARTIEQQTNNNSLKKAEISGELAGLEKDFEPFKNVVLLKSKGEAELRFEIDKFERLILEMGNINLKALEVYDSVNAQYNDMLQKKDTLKKEKEDVLVMMHEIEGKKKGLFMKTFDELNSHFRKFFSALTTKADAFLQIENPENPFEENTGVLIKVRIAEGKLLDIRSLSGGEKTLTALAFIFSIQEFEPASFYIMDEIDAALDRKNSEKLAELIKEYSKKAQYIVITHNDSITVSANVVYGVSMDAERAISSVVSMKL